MVMTFLKHLFFALTIRQVLQEEVCGGRGPKGLYLGEDWSNMKWGVAPDMFVQTASWTGWA